MSTFQTVSALNQSIDLTERFAQYLLNENKSENDLLMAKQLGSFITFFDSEIQMSQKRKQIFENFVKLVDSATEKPDCDQILKEFHEEIDKAKKQLSNNKKCEKYNNFMKLLENQNLGHSDDEIRTVSETINTVDPISKLPIVDPVKNKICGHTYDKTSILQLIEQNPRTRCPIAGCSAADFVKKSDLIPNNILKRILNSVNSNSPKKFKPQE